ncbi:Uncharacterised protein [Brevundimonas vesicularis]|uniref:Uncharacterized protein n=1 Tax=Brevundimonas vesicularis TaxID=41276 RepID=A0A2X1BN99_BREVE|nr:Uncharacterised protein [Brevundimonas vesicularis]
MKTLEKAIIRDIAKGIEVNLYSQENRQKYAAL